MRLGNSSSLIYHKLLVEGLPVIEVSQVVLICALLYVSDVNGLVFLYVKILLASSDRYFEPVFERSKGATPVLIVSAVRIIGKIKIKQKFTVG